MGYEATATTSALCNSLIQKYWSMIKPVHDIRRTFVRQLGKFEQELASMTFSAQDALNDALNDLDSKVKNLIPEDSIDAVREIKSFVDSCSCFFQDGGAQDMISSVLGSAIGIYNQIEQEMGDIGLPEVKAGAIANTLNKLLDGANIGIPGGGNISDILAKADCMLTCINTLCPNSVNEAQVILDDLQSLYDDFQLDDDPASTGYGKIKFSDIYTRVGLSPFEVENMEQTINTVNSLQKQTNEGIEKSVNTLKNALKEGLI